MTGAANGIFMNTDNITAQLQNWDNFCRYHANSDWNGTWTRYSAQRKIIESFNCIRSFQISTDGSEIYHQNHYTYADGRKETKTFGPYQKPVTRCLFLDNSFSWGSTKIESDSNFGFETGFRYEDRRTSVVIMYDKAGSLEMILVIVESLNTFPEKPNSPFVKEFSRNGRGTAKTITSDWLVSSPIDVSWNRLENLGDDYQTLYFSDGISITSPQQIASRQDFLAAVDWQINPNLLQRGIRNYDSSGFIGFTLQTFIFDT